MQGYGKKTLCSRDMVISDVQSVDNKTGIFGDVRIQRMKCSEDNDNKNRVFRGWRTRISQQLEKGWISF